jgi:hypothetical protein
MDATLAQTSISNGSVWLLLGMSVFVILYLTVRPKKRDPLSTSPFRSSLTQQKALERDMQNVIVELSEMTRQMTSQLETRAAKLDALIQEADEKLRELRAAVRTERVRGEAPGNVEIDSLATSMPLVPPAAAIDNNPHTEDRWAEVYQLSDTGLALPQIAQQLGRPRGEIELILALRPKLPAPADRATTDRAPTDRATIDSASASAQRTPSDALAS